MVFTMEIKKQGNTVLSKIFLWNREETFLDYMHHFSEQEEEETT